VPGDCCGAQDCAPRVCWLNRCEACSSSSQCGAGSVCCNGLCRPGDCCGDADCADGMACIAGSCAACRADADCGEGSKCCEGRCLAGAACCVGADCEQGACIDNQCVACSKDADCGANKSCCLGQCVPGGTCEVGVKAVTSCDDDSDCAQGRMCCSGKCIAGECCGDSQCPNGLQCIEFACQPCSSDAQCGPGHVCCGGMCQEGDCCPGEACGNGQTCAAFSCSSCERDTDCPAGATCCDGACVDGNCCVGEDCGQYVCKANQCSACWNHADCPEGARCCNGACVEGAQCCSNQDCGAGQVCRFNRCAACANQRDCGPGQVCCDGQCRSGTCCATKDCPRGEVCSGLNVCVGCSSDNQCAPGQKCCSGTCVDGSCCVNEDCGPGQVCTGHGCVACETTADCGYGQLCCNGSCKAGTCCSDEDCGQLICDGNTCRACNSDAECGRNAKCCSGACYKGIQCCSSADCAGGGACVNGTCNTCKTDLDCGGLSCCKDERGNRCLAFCERESGWRTKVEFDKGEFDGTTSAGDPKKGCDPGKLCWNGSATKIEQPYIWIPASAENAVYRFDTTTGARKGPFRTLGGSPSRTAVNPFDNTLWVANRGWSEPSSVTHFDNEGNILCWAAVPGVARSAVTDARGDVWIGSWDNSYLYKFSGTEIDETVQVSPPRCKSLGGVSLNKFGGTVPRPYGAAMDSNNHIWVADRGGDTVVEVDATTATVLRRVPLCDSCKDVYGITVDKEYVWVGGYGCGRVYRIDRVTGACSAVQTGGSPRGVAVATDGYVYAAMNSSANIARIDRKTLKYTLISVSPISNPIGVAIDTSGRIWAVGYGDSAVLRYDPVKGERVTFRTGSSPYVYSDMTGQQTINAGLNPGRWVGIQDAAYSRPHWQRLEIEARTPPGTSVSARVRTAATKPELKNIEFSPWLTEFPADLTDLDLSPYRYIEVEVRLVTDSIEKTPVVERIGAIWAP
jgi:DNA-binding beta-propeller fold protein YncE